MQVLRCAQDDTHIIRTTDSSATTHTSSPASGTTSWEAREHQSGAAGNFTELPLGHLGSVERSGDVVGEVVGGEQVQILHFVQDDILVLRFAQDDMGIGSTFTLTLRRGASRA